MSLQVRVTFEGTVRLNEDTWQATVDPTQLPVLGRPSTALRGPSVIFLEGEPTETGEGEIEFPLKAAHLVNLGTLPTAIVVRLSAAEHAEQPDGAAESAAWPAQALKVGDKAFLHSLASDMRRLGEKFLQAMRREFPGQLEYREPSGRWIETPDAWWTIRPQPLKEDFYISVRRPPDDYEVPRSIVMKRERATWSRLYLGGEQQLEAVMSVMRQASRFRR